MKTLDKWIESRTAKDPAFARLVNDPIEKAAFELGAVLAAGREAKGISIKQMARRLRINSVTVESMEMDVRTVPTRVLNQALAIIAPDVPLVFPDNMERIGAAVRRMVTTSLSKRQSSLTLALP